MRRASSARGRHVRDVGRSKRTHTGIGHITWVGWDAYREVQIDDGTLSPLIQYPGAPPAPPACARAPGCLVAAERDAMDCIASVFPLALPNTTTARPHDDPRSALSNSGHRDATAGLLIGSDQCAYSVDGREAVTGEGWRFTFYCFFFAVQLGWGCALCGCAAPSSLTCLMLYSFGVSL